MKDVGVNKIQALAGHSDIATTQRYMHLAPPTLESSQISLAKWPILANVRSQIGQCVFS